MGNQKWVSERFKNVISDVFGLIIASVLYAVAFNIFIERARDTTIIVGGLVGISTTLNAIFEKIPIGLATMLLNVPLVIAVLVVYGWKFVFKTAVGTVCSSLSIDLLSFFPVSNDDPLLCAILGGVSLGAALGIYYSRGFNTGGSDLILFLFRKKIKRISNGNLLLIIDGLIVVVSSLVLRDPELIFYSAVCIIFETKMIDIVSGGVDSAKMTIIVSDAYEAIAQAIATDLERGVTLLDSHGFFSGKSGKAIMCVIRPSEEYAMKKIVMGYDKNAFIVFAQANQVIGNGFKEIDQ